MRWHAIADATDNFIGITKALCGATVETQSDGFNIVTARLLSEKYTNGSQFIECEKCEKKLQTLKVGA
jgi:hypothetical protein